MMKRNWMAQWTNLQRNNGFVNPTPFPMLCEKSGALHLAEPGLTAGRQAGRLAGWQAGRPAGWQAGRPNTGMVRKFKNSLGIEMFEFLLRLPKTQPHYSCTNAFG